MFFCSVCSLFAIVNFVYLLFYSFFNNISLLPIKKKRNRMLHAYVFKIKHELKSHFQFIKKQCVIYNSL